MGNNLKEDINYSQHNFSLIQTLPNISTWPPPKPHANDPISDSEFTWHYLYALTTIVSTREPPPNPIKLKLPNSFTMASTHQSYMFLHNWSIQEQYAEISPTLHSSLILIVQLFGDECLVTFDKHRVIVSKKANITEVIRYPMNVLWQSQLHDQDQGNQKSNIIAHIRSKYWCQHIKPMAPQHPREYLPTSKQDLAIFYHQFLCWPKTHTLLQAINDVSLSTWSVLTAKLVTKFLLESWITSKGYLDQ